MGKMHERKHNCFWCDGNIRVYQKSDGRWIDNNGIDRSYLFEQDKYLSYRGKNKGHGKGKPTVRDGKGKYKETIGWERKWEKVGGYWRTAEGKVIALQGTATGMDADYNVIWKFEPVEVEATAATGATTVVAEGNAGTFPLLDPLWTNEDGEVKPVSDSPSSAVSQENGEQDEEELEWGPPFQWLIGSVDAKMLQKFMVEESALRQFVTQTRDSVDLETATKMWWMENIANMNIKTLANLCSLCDHLIKMEKFPSFVQRMKWKQWHSSQFEDSIFGDEDEEF